MKKSRIFIILVFLVTSIFSGGMFAASQNHGGAAAGDNTFSPAQVKDIEQIVYQYLMKNPKVLLQVSQALRKQEMQKVEQAALSGIKNNIAALFNNPHSPTAGNSDGNVQLVEFFDYRCGHCKAMGPVVTAVLKQDANVKVIYKELPIFGGPSRLAAKAALAANKQGHYKTFHNALFAFAGPLNKKNIFKIAKKVGLNVAQLKKEMKAPWVEQQIEANFQLAKKLKLQGTPAFVISNQAHTQFRFIPGATSEANLLKLINAVQ